MNAQFIPLRQLLLMLSKFRFILISLFLPSSFCFAQVTEPRQNTKAGNGMSKPMSIGRFSGKVKESNSNTVVEYASVQLWQSKFDTLTKQLSDVLIGGMLTDQQGEFSLENLPLNGNFRLKISALGFIPYEQRIKFDIDFKALKNGGDRTQLADKADKDLGNIVLEINTKVLKEVTIEAEKSLYQMRIDRKVFNVDKSIVSTGGSAEDVMRSIPAVQLDVDGNVTLRNATPQIFVDGKPTTLTLEQLPADNIQSVEIITNPSAKFDAGESNAGILNIVLKKNKLPGYNGSLRAAAGTRLKYVLGGDINLKEGKINFFASGNFVKRLTNPATITSRDDKSDDFGINQNSKILQENRFNHGRFGFDFFINNRNTITISETIVDGRMSINDNTRNDSLNLDTVFSYFQRSSRTVNAFRNYGTQIGFKHLFPKSGQELTMDINYNSPTNTTDASFESQNYLSNDNPFGLPLYQEAKGGGYNKLLVGQMDYAEPFGENSKMEFGARVAIRNFKNETNNYFFIDSLNDFVLFPVISSNYKFNEKVYAAYGTYANAIHKLNYQVGLRMESSDYSGSLIRFDTTFKIQYPLSFFPSAFVTYKLPKNQDLQVNYARKINRPNFFQLNPFPDFSDPQNISIGNAALKPEFVNNINLDYQKITEKGTSFLVSLYMKYSTNLITRFQYRGVSSNENDSIIYNTYVNANSSMNYGLEITNKLNLTKWWELITNFNFYNASINGGKQNGNISTEQLSAFGKMSWNFTFPKNISLQLSGEYQSKTVLPVGGSSSGNTAGGGSGGRGMGSGGFGGGLRDQQLSSAQGYVLPNYGVDLAAKWDFIKNVASLSISVTDILKTKRYSSFSETPYFTQNYFRQRDQQVIRVTLTFRFGKMDASLFKRKNNRIESEGMQGL